MAKRALQAAALTLALSIAACGGSDSEGPVECQTGYILCGEQCVDALSVDHCGACDVTCDAGLDCLVGGGGTPTCMVDCEARLTNAYANAETGAWDGVSRTAANFDLAKTDCEVDGGRLPTATELARLARDTSTPAKTGTLWSLTADGPFRRFSVNIATGAAAVNTIASASVAYRCLCPSAPPAAFGEGACFGPPGASQCFTPAGSPQSVDAYDRLALTKAGAVWECAFQGANLPTVTQVVEQVALGLGNGTTSALHTGDDASYDRDAVVGFGGTGLASVATSQDVSNLLKPFRCMGINDAALVPDAAIATSVHLATRTGMQGDLNDRAAAADFGDAITTCWNAGGHLPTATELASLVNGGLPNGSGTALWTADTLYYWGDPQYSWTTPSYKWSGSPAAAGYDWGTAATSWIDRFVKDDLTDRPFRCVYYPVTAYTGPAETDCNGGCTAFSKAVAGTSVTSRAWFDLGDRTAATFTQAVADCASVGATLPSMRDYTEVIRAGLSGSNALLWTSDFLYPSGAYAVIWTGTTNGTFTGATTGAATAITSTRAYRCMWTNELR